jgi:DNA-binding NtrC family response regulator
MRKTKRVMLVDDDPSFLNIFKKIFTENGYDTITCADAKNALETLDRKRINVAVVDIVMPGMNGISLLKEMVETYPEIKTIMLTGEGSIAGAVEAMASGAFTYLLKPVNIEELLMETEKALHLQQIEMENFYLKEELNSSRSKYNLIGNSPAIKSITEQLPSIASSNASVIIGGESGTGKEIAAGLIHSLSERKNKPFIKVNCAALSESLLESELFGHEKGAFTGATTARPGRFELADGGTLFLDEITEMSANVQVKLLRVLQEREFERVGGSKSLTTDFRLISASNRNLHEAIADGSFREDLFYRINVIPLNMPPLRERRADIPLLLDYFSHLFAVDYAKEFLAFSENSVHALTSYSWPGNVRELSNVVERLVVLARRPVIRLSDLPLEITRSIGEIDCDNQLTISAARREFEKNFIINALVRNQWNVSKTATAIGIARKNLQRKLSEYDITRP